MTDRDTDNEALADLPPLIPERDELDSRALGQRARNQDIAPPRRSGAVAASTWPVRILLFLLVLAVGAAGAGAWVGYRQYGADLRQTQLRLNELERLLALTGEDAEESASEIMQQVGRTIEQYDLLWANWRNNNQTIADLRAEIARLETVNQGQDDIAANNSRNIADTNDALLEREAQWNEVSRELAELVRSVTAMGGELDDLQALRADIDGIRQLVVSGGDTLGGVLGRVERLEQAIESVDAFRLQVNDTLLRLQDNLDGLQRVMALPVPVIGEQ